MASTGGVPHGSTSVPKRQRQVYYSIPCRHSSPIRFLISSAFVLPEQRQAPCAEQKEVSSGAGEVWKQGVYVPQAIVGSSISSSAGSIQASKRRDVASAAGREHGGLFRAFHRIERDASISSPQPRLETRSVGGANNDSSPSSSSSAREAEGMAERTSSPRSMHLSQHSRALKKLESQEKRKKEKNDRQKGSRHRALS